MSSLLESLYSTLSGEVFDQEMVRDTGGVPVTLEEFITNKELFLGLKGLSGPQMELAAAMSQIYREDTLILMYHGDEKAAHRRWRQTCKEIIMQLGKGSGKDFTSTVAVAYVVYLLMCLKDPAEYFDKSSGDAIDIINIAINADQAQRVFFENFVNKIEKCPWFEGKYEKKAGHIKFDKNINVYSGHSEREAFEGYNTLMVILDEIAGFKEAPDDDEEGDVDKTSKAIYKMYRGSVTSRFPDMGKLVLLSFPRHEDDFIQKAYNRVIGEKEVRVVTERLKRDPELPDGYPGNELDVTYEVDTIIRYARPKVFAMRLPSWMVNPARKIEDYTDDFFDDIGDALGRFACMPSNATRGFFKNMDKAEVAFSRLNGVDSDGIFHASFTPKPDVQYYVHVDLAQKHDKCAVAIAHVDKWISYNVPGSALVEYLPLVVVDAIRWWTPTKEKSVDFKAVVEFIKSVRRRGFDIKLATFDRWNSHDTMMDLERNNIQTDILSVAKKHYDDWLVTMYDGRLYGPHEDDLLKEMRELREKKGKVDHPRKGNKDLSDAVCGAIFNAVAHTPKEESLEADALTLQDLKKQLHLEEEENRERRLRYDRPGVIEPPKRSVAEAPKDIQDMLADLMRVI